MKTFKIPITAVFAFIAMAFATTAISQVKDGSKTDTIPNVSYDNFKNKPNSSSSYVIIKSKETGKVLFEQNLENGKCADCYEKLTSKADSCYKTKNYADATTLYTLAFMLNDNKGKVKHRLTAACCHVKQKDIDTAFENLDKVVFGAKFHNLYEISSNECFKPLQKDSRWKKLIDGLNTNLDEVQQKLKAGTEGGQ